MFTSSIEGVSTKITTSSASSSTGSRRGNLKDDRNYDTNMDNSGDNNKDGDEDEELVVVASRGQNALADFPHSRENCVTHPFSGDKKLYCGNCYCYVCDNPAKDCKSWGNHCNATHNDPHWKSEREKAKQARICAASTLSVAATSRTATAPRPAVVSRSPSSSSSGWSARRMRKSPQSGRRSAEFSVRKLLQEITSVHPVEIQPSVSSGFVTPLRHYQKQSLAFMVDTEKQHLRGGWLADEVGMGKSAVVLALVASNPASPESLAKTGQIKNVLDEFEQREAKKKQIQEAHNIAIAKLSEEKRKQDESIKDENEKIRDWNEYRKHRDAYNQAVRSEDQKMEEEIDQIPPIKDRVKLKATVILTSVSLIGQWEDEAKKHSPGLVVKAFHTSRSKEIKLFTETDADIIISSSTFKWPAVVTNCLEFHRVVHDESHLLIRGGASAKLDYANQIASSLRWGVTATPATNSYMDLIPQLKFINGAGANSTVQIGYIDAVHYNPDEASFNKLVTWLKTYYMVRHTKSQRINGSEALALPPSTTSTVMLEMSKFEDEAFNCINPVTSKSIVKHCANGVKDFTAEGSFCFQMTSLRKRHEKNAHRTEFEIEREKLLEESPSNALRKKVSYRYKPECLAKVVALRKDLSELRQTEPAMRAVVFTQYLDLHEASVRGLKQDGFEVFQFTGSSKTKSRDKAIRKFQDTTNGKPAVFVITLRSGNVGITLTAASRVYLLEPSLDPAVEVQAAGRIHRLGQNKPCHVVKFAFKNSYEENVIELHKKILAGEITIVDQFVPSEAMKILAKGLRGVALPKAKTPNETKKRRSANHQPPARDILDMRKRVRSLYASSSQPPNPQQQPPGQAARKRRFRSSSTSSRGNAGLDDSGNSRHDSKMTDQEKKEKERFLMFTRVLMKYLEQRDIDMHIKAKAQIKECYEKNQSGDPNYRSLTTSMKARLRQTVGETYWKKAHDYLDHFLKQREKQRSSSGGSDQQPSSL